MPHASREYVGNIANTVQSFWHGMSITLSYMLRRPITTQYPDRTAARVADTLPARYRGLLEVDPAICTGCLACERACPISCIQMVVEKDPANPKQRVVTQFDIDEAKCMFCGLCVEPCPTGSIQHTREFEASVRSVRNLVVRWADPLAPFPVYKVPKGTPFFPRAPLGSLLREKLQARRWDAPGPVYLKPEPPKPPEAAKPAAPAAPAVKPAAAGVKPAPSAARPAGPSGAEGPAPGGAAAGPAVQGPAPSGPAGPTTPVEASTAPSPPSPVPAAGEKPQS